MEYNYLDWQKSKADASFEKYLSELHQYNKQQYDVQLSRRKKPSPRHWSGAMYWFLKNHASKKSMTFLLAILIQFFLFIILLNNQQTYSDKECSMTEKPYLKEVKWHHYSITSDLSACLPFELKTSSSVLPVYLQQYVTTKSEKAESLHSFSVTIENITFNGANILNYTNLLPVQDEYMQHTGTYFTSREPLQHFMVKEHSTWLEQGSYTLNGKTYLYDNYTLMKGNKAIKLIISYLKDDNLLCEYADIVLKSLYQKPNGI